jgi:GNAT superfamily N-acetyltransferase
MFDATVRLLGDDDWALYRAVWLAALEESPAELGADLESEAAADDGHWRAQLNAARRLVVERDGRPCGVVSVEGSGERPRSATLSGLWVEPSARASGVAGRLVEGAVRLAASEGAERLYYWVGTENARAIGFAIGFGFRVTSQRRPARGPSVGVGGTEIALVLSLEDDWASVPNASGGGRPGGS